MKELDILLVEDNPGDIRLTREALKERDLKHRLSVAEDGDKALDFLFKREDYEGARTPDLILLDLNLPKRSGFEVLAMVKADEKPKKIPVVMLSTSNSSSDIDSCYQGHANCYVSKPVNFEDFVEVIHKIEEFWLSTVELPQIGG